jgi:signal transduction histidine kinase
LTKGVQLLCSNEQAVPLITADGRRVQQILWNLLHNAVKFTPASGHVEIGIKSAHDRVTISIEDTGQGIAPDFLPFVFDRFRQADPSATRGAWGLGIGLSIVKHLVELHCGSVEVFSRGLGLGSTFFVHLPVSVGPIGKPRENAAVGEASLAAAKDGDHSLADANEAVMRIG